MTHLTFSLSAFRLRHRDIIRRSLGVALFISGAVALPSSRAEAQWATTYEQFYLPGGFN
jgi:hypothetical protein